MDREKMIEEMANDIPAEMREIYVRCGCFFGTIEQFEEKVNKTHKFNEQYRKEYIEAIKYIKAVM